MRGLFGTLTTEFRASEDGADRSPSSDFWYEPLGSGTGSGIRVTPDIGLKSSALSAVVRTLSETVGSLDLRIYQETALGPVEAPNHPVSELIRFQPNAWQTAVEFWEMMMLHAVLRGTAYAQIKPGPRGAVDQLWPLHGDRVEPEQLRDGTLRFRVTDERTGLTRILLQEEVFRVPGLSSDGIQGLRAVDIAAEAIGLGMAADQYASRVFSNKLNIGGFLVHPKTLSETAQKNLIHALMMRFAGANNSHRPIVLQEGMDFKRASMDASEAQLLEARKWQVAEIARFWRVPLHMLGIYEGSTRSNVEQQALDFIKYTLIPWTSRIVQAIRRDLIVAKQNYVAIYDFDSLLQGDAAARGEYAAKALGSGGGKPWLTQNEVREREGYNRLPDIKYDTLDTAPGQQKALPPASGGAAQIEDNTIEACAARLIAKENTAIRKAVMRFADDHDAFRKWASAFYGGHCSEVMKVLGLPKEAARSYCTGCHDQLIGANDVEGLLTRREDTGPAEIASIIAKWKEEE